ncbi:MAG: hypothetical protein ABH829_04695 [archaeon]
MIDSIIGKYSKIKGLCEELADNGYNVKINYRGNTIAEIGADVEPWMFGIVGPMDVKDVDTLLDVSKKMNLI